MTNHQVGTREEWLAAREALLKREKEHTRFGDELARERRALPWVRVEKDYRFQTDEGEKSLVVFIFETDEDYRKAHEVLDAMPSEDTPGRRTSVTRYDVAARMTP